MPDEICQICNDRSTGKHYGAVSCDGCKGFFRRSIRKKYHYVCRFDKCCDVTKNKRNACRSCRLQKCVRAGMKANAIQTERDCIGKRKKVTESVENDEELVTQLINAENLCQQLRSSVIKRTQQTTYDCGKVKWVCEDRRATLDDIGKSIHQQLLLLVEWAKSLPQFSFLTVPDKEALLKGSATSIIVLGVAYRSICLTVDDTICLANDTLLQKEHAEQVGDMNHFSCVVGRIIDEIVNPMRRMGVDLVEYIALKAILFFNPVVPGMHESGSIETVRHSCLKLLSKRCTEKAQAAQEDELIECRIGKLLLILPPLQSIAQQLVEDVQLARVFGLVNVDNLMSELILNDQKASDPQLQASLSSPVESVKAELEE